MSRYQKVNGELTEEGYRKYGNVRRKARKDIVGGALTSAAGAGVGMFGGYAARKLSGGKVNLKFTPKVVGSVMSAHGGKRMAGGAYDLALNKAGVTDDYGRLADSSNPLARPLIDGRKYALGAGATVGAGVPYAVKALNKDKDNLPGEAIRKTSAKKRVVVKNVERGPGIKDFSMKNSTRKKLNKGFKVINTPEEGPTVNEENKAEFIKPKKQRQNKKKIIKNVGRGPGFNEGNTSEPIKPKKKSKNKKFFKRKKKMSNPNNVGDDIDNLNEELMGKWKKGLNNIKHSSIGGNDMSYYEDEIYRDGYLDGYYDSMELYHADTEMTEEERARRKKRRRNVALGVAGVAGAGAAGYAIGRALRKRGVPRLTGGTTRPTGPRPTGPRPTGPRPTGPRPTGPRPTGPRPTGPRPTGPRPTGPRLTGPRLTGPRPTGLRLTGPKLKRVHVPDYDVEEPIGWDFKRNKPKYKNDAWNEKFYKSYEDLKNVKYYDHDAKKWKYGSY